MDSYEWLKQTARARTSGALGCPPPTKAVCYDLRLIVGNQCQSGRYDPDIGVGAAHHVTHVAGRGR
jgi:hypothetical protein